MTSDQGVDASPRLTVSAVARRLGVAPATLRTWDRRYGVGPSKHVSGSHRRYGPADLRRLETMRRLLMAGAAPSEAARVALDTPFDASVAVRPATGFPDLQGRLVPADVPPVTGEVAGAQEIVRGLIRAAVALDSETVTGTVRLQLTDLGLVVAWERVLLPVLVAVGSHWAATGQGVEVEHLLSDSVTGVLREHAAGHAPVHPVRPVLLACAPGDLHVLPLHALSTGLAELGTATRILGAAVPAEALIAAVRRTGPAVLFVWSQTPATGDADTLVGLPTTRPATAVVAGGPGWDLPALPDRVAVADGLGAAVALVAQALQH